MEIIVKKIGTQIEYGDQGQIDAFIMYFGPNRCSFDWIPYELIVISNILALLITITTYEADEFFNYINLSRCINKIRVLNKKRFKER